MYFRRFRIWFFAIAAFVVLLSATVLVQKRLDTIVKEDKLVDEGNIEGLPPMVAFTTVALGGFRGILADMLWLRTNGLQQQGKYFEMVQLASWITKLQPKFTGATGDTEGVLERMNGEASDTPIDKICAIYPYATRNAVGTDGTFSFP